MLGKVNLRRFSSNLNTLNTKSLQHLQVDIDSLDNTISHNQAMSENSKFYRNMYATLYDVSKYAQKNRAPYFKYVWVLATYGAYYYHANAALANSFYYMVANSTTSLVFGLLSVVVAVNKRQLLAQLSVLPCGTKVNYTLFDGTTYTASIAHLSLSDIRHNLIMIRVAQTDQGTKNTSISFNVSEGKRQGALFEVETLLTVAHPDCHAI